MGRKSEPGIIFYRINCNHVWNKKIRLLFNEFDSDGYWIWQCILSEAYRQRGYYFDYNDKEAVELFATDVCKKRVSLVDEVVTGCVRRGLFEESLFNSFGILTSAFMQETYLDATAERRRKGTGIELIEELILINISEDSKNISIVPWNNSILPRKNPIVPRKNPQSRVEYSKEEKSIEPKGSTDGKPSSTPTDPDKELKKEYEVLEKTKELVYRFIRDKQPRFIEPYKDFWNAFATKNNLALVKLINDKRKKKFTKRIHEPLFNMIEILRKAQCSDFLITSKWFGFDWLLENDGNYLKVLEGNYDNGKDLSKMKIEEDGTIAQQIKLAAQKEKSS